MPTKAKGATFLYGNTGAEAATAVARVSAIAPPTQEVPDIDISHLESATREYTSGILENGEAEFTFEYLKTAQDTMDALIGADRAFKILYADGSKHLWEGYIKSLAVQELTLDTIITAKGVVKVSGALTFTAGA